MAIYSFSPFGFEGSIVTVEVDLRRGIPATDIVGLADSAVKEERERVQCAIRNSGLKYPSERVLIALSPADLKKEGAGFDLPIALGVLQKQFTESVLVMGELELSGAIRPVRGIHAACSTALASGIQYAIVPNANLEEALATGIKAIGCDTLYDAYKLPEDLSTRKIATVSNTDETITFAEPDSAYKDKIDLTEKEMLALVVAASGRFNMMFFGSPGCGKTILMQYMQYLVPTLSLNEAQSVTRIWSLAGLIKPSEPLIRIRPFRMPHQTASIEGICGGGPNCRPGEISLAHNGVLFLDEAAEFRSSVLQMLRVPLENKSITLSRAGRSTTYPANFQLLMALNPCPCGNYGSSQKICLCSAKSVDLYWRKIGGPLMDKVPIRLHIDPSEGERKSYTLKELQSYVEIATKKSRAIGTDFRDLSVEQILDMIPAKTFERLREVSHSYGWSERRCYDLYRIWLTIVSIFGDDAEKYTTEYLDKALSIMGDFAFPN
jgi:magnesium chelatase family protein